MKTSRQFINCNERYIYSINKNNKLSNEQRRFYEENGFLVIPKLVDEELLEHCR